MDISDIQFDKYRSVCTDDLFKVRGKVVNVVGLTIESAGPSAKLGDICMIYPSAANAGSKPALAEVVGFRNGRNLLMPYEDVEGIGPGSSVENTGAPLKYAWMSPCYPIHWMDWDARMKRWFYRVRNIQ